VTLNRAIEFQGVTYEVGTEASADIKSLAFAPGYQYDIVRRNRISLSIATQVYLLKTSADLAGTATVNGQAVTKTASGSFFAPLPILGPRLRWYPLRSGIGGFVPRDVVLWVRQLHDGARFRLYIAEPQLAGEPWLPDGYTAKNRHWDQPDRDSPNPEGARRWMRSVMVS
jgi:hypothetical protein